jgi:hypothetical protein
MLQPPPQCGVDGRRAVPGVPQLWTVHASRHVHQYLFLARIQKRLLRNGECWHSVSQFVLWNIATVRSCSPSRCEGGVHSNFGITP